jgi:hypothetical protein
MSDQGDISKSSVDEVMWIRLSSFSSVFLRFALGLSFLSAVADRFGLWGAFGQRNVA